MVYSDKQPKTSGGGIVVQDEAAKNNEETLDDIDIEAIWSWLPSITLTLTAKLFGIMFTPWLICVNTDWLC